MKKIYLLNIILIIILGCSACQNKEVDYVDEGIHTQTESSKVDMTTGKIKDKLGVPDSWTEKVDSDKGITIGANIIVPDVSSMKVVEASEFHPSNEDKKQFIASITSEAVYDYPVAYDEMTKEQLEEYIAYNEDCLKQSSDIMQDNEKEDIKNTLQELYTYYELAPEEYSLTTDYSSYSYYTKYDNRNVIIQFMGGDENTDIIMRSDDYNVNIESEVYDIVGFQIMNKEIYAENKCKLNEDDAKELAYGFVDKLGYGDFEIVDTYPLACTAYKNNEHELIYNGYTFVMNRNIYGVTVDARDWTLPHSHPQSEYMSSMSEEYNGWVQWPGYGFEIMYVCVNDDGVVYFSYRAPYKLGEVISSDVNLLSFDRIQNTIREEIIKQEGIYDYKLFNNMELKYVPIKDEVNPGKYSIIPVWILSAGDVYSTSAYVVVNAIDGTIVYMYEQYYEIEFETDSD